ncbi:hypothetical protein GYMLUDRAFT_240747 [Collybiopsis luxurians FD-317 M1]|nr:hypothetical protein GYMLUDRAFT_240747 [Collybiopsis luxurians FD-317 M1]
MSEEIRHLVTPPSTPHRSSRVRSSKPDLESDWIKAQGKILFPSPLKYRPGEPSNLAPQPCTMNVTTLQSPERVSAPTAAPDKSASPSAIWIESDSGKETISDSSFSSDPPDHSIVSSNPPDHSDAILGPRALSAVEADALARFPRTYVVYFGFENAKGLYYQWRGTGNAYGANEATEGVADAIFCSFENRELGEMAYRECRTTGVLDLLKNAGPKDHYIVVKGERPGVYTCLTVMGQGLGWHGGEVKAFAGTLCDAKAHFTQLREAGKVKSVPSWGILASRK